MLQTQRSGNPYLSIWTCLKSQLPESPPQWLVDLTQGPDVVLVVETTPARMARLFRFWWERSPLRTKLLTGIFCSDKCDAPVSGCQVKVEKQTFSARGSGAGEEPPHRSLPWGRSPNHERNVTTRRLQLARYSAVFLENGAPRGARTPDPLITNQVLYQLSYRGTPLT